MYTQETMISWAKGYENALGCESESDAYFDPEGAAWTYHAKFDDVATLAHNIGLSSPEEARAWLESEIEIQEESGCDYRADEYRSILSEPIEECIIAGHGKTAGKHLWDGCHRVAGAYAQGISLPAIIGKQK